MDGSDERRVSGRQRFRPLEFWAHERVVYAHGEVTGIVIHQHGINVALAPSPMIGSSHGMPSKRRASGGSVDGGGSEGSQASSLNGPVAREMRSKTAPEQLQQQRWHQRQLQQQQRHQPQQQQRQQQQQRGAEKRRAEAAAKTDGTAKRRRQEELPPHPMQVIDGIGSGLEDESDDEGGSSDDATSGARPEHQAPSSIASPKPGELALLAEDPPAPCDRPPASLPAGLLVLPPLCPACLPASHVRLLCRCRGAEAVYSELSAIAAGGRDLHSGPNGGSTDGAPAFTLSAELHRLRAEMRSRSVEMRPSSQACPRSAPNTSASAAAVPLPCMHSVASDVMGAKTAETCGSGRGGGSKSDADDGVAVGAAALIDAARDGGYRAGRSSATVAAATAVTRTLSGPSGELAQLPAELAAGGVVEEPQTPTPEMGLPHTTTPKVALHVKADVADVATEASAARMLSHKGGSVGALDAAGGAVLGVRRWGREVQYHVRWDAASAPVWLKATGLSADELEVVQQYARCMPLRHEW